MDSRRARLAALIMVAFSAAALLPPPATEAAMSAPGPAAVPTPPALPADGRGDTILGVSRADLATWPAPTAPAQRFIPQPPGTVTHEQYVYGPFPIQAGHDFSRLGLDLPMRDGFITQFHYILVDAVTGEVPTNMEVHIHHALWFRNNLEGRRGVLSFNNWNFEDFLFGTGEERTDVNYDLRADAVPGGPRYGLPFGSQEGTTILAMLHNKQARPRVVEVILDMTFVHGTADQIVAAADCGMANPAAQGCRAGQVFHPIDGVLWGRIFDVPRVASGSGTYTWPVNLGLANSFVAPWSGTLVASIGHLHQNGEAIIVVNEGPAGSGCEADLDHDGLPGVTLARSDKIDRVAAAWPASEDFQMGITPPDWRAPVRAGDRIAQFGVYANDLHASYVAMAFAGVHVDTLAPPPPRASGPCRLADLQPLLLHTPGGNPTATIPNRAWDTPLLPLCGPGLGPACDGPAVFAAGGLQVPVVTISGFTFVPGGYDLSRQLGPLAAPPKVPRGSSLTFLNADSASAIRHSITSCPLPCNGPYVANYPLPDGRFDSALLPNLDALNGEGPNPNPAWTTPADLAVGVYSYYCRIHPTMRGAFEVVP